MGWFPERLGDCFRDCFRVPGLPVDKNCELEKKQTYQHRMRAVQSYWGQRRGILSYYYRMIVGTAVGYSRQIQLQAHAE